METQNGTIRVITLSHQEVDVAIRKYVENYFTPQIVFSADYSITYQLSEPILESTTVKAIVDLRFFDNEDEEPF